MEMLPLVKKIYDRSGFLMQEWQHPQVSLGGDGLSLALDAGYGSFRVPGRSLRSRAPFVPLPAYWFLEVQTGSQKFHTSPE
ncbi:hypothetical protein N7471_011816 [Penicillium samsonianum]|uniref:uncharacterized protein n=1 Tax=Penicillium samsonianum TaxID=1882272 RepID=UPI0025474FB5|nr:uncharacterized protein N7471_011816 [Penicillium samsonianum]KAJ6124499.1 hypothetical protein N7471_011816 [Penicillium samsonianum]